MSELQPIFSDYSFAYEGHLNFLINLDRPAEAVLQCIGQRTCKGIRRGLRDGFVKMTEVTRD